MCFYVWNKVGYKTIKKNVSISRRRQQRRNREHIQILTMASICFIFDGRMIYDELQLTMMIKFILIDLPLYRPITKPALVRIPSGSTISISLPSWCLTNHTFVFVEMCHWKKCFVEVKTIFFYKPFWVLQLLLGGFEK